jgi:hypothetical protein
VGTRAICRREDAHPGAQLRFTDHDGHRFQVFVTDQADGEIAALELRHRQRARVEDRIRAAKATGLANLPFDRWRRNAVWLELVLAAQDLTCWAQALLLNGPLAVAEPKTLRYRLLHVAARIAHHARRRRGGGRHPGGTVRQRPVPANGAGRRPLPGRGPAAPRGRGPAGDRRPPGRWPTAATAPSSASTSSARPCPSSARGSAARRWAR